MLVTRPALHPKAAAAVRSLESKGLHPTASHVLWLQDAAKKIKKASKTRTAEMIDWPLECGGIRLYRISIFATDWLLKLPVKMQDDPFVQAFACAHSHDPDTLKSLCTPLKLWLHVKGWKSQILASKQALAACLAIVMGDEDETVEVVEVTPRKEPAKIKTDDEPADFGFLVLSLCRRYPGTTPQYWSCEVSAAYALEMLAIDEDCCGVSGHEITMGVAFRSIVAEIEKELRNG